MKIAFLKNYRIFRGIAFSVLVICLTGCRFSSSEGSNGDLFHLLDVPITESKQIVEFELNFKKGRRYDLIAAFVTADGVMIQDPNFEYKGLVTIEDIRGQELFRAEIIDKKGIYFDSEFDFIGRTEKGIARKAAVLKISDFNFSLSEEFKNQNYENIEFVSLKDPSKENIANPKFRVFIRPEPGWFY